MTNLQALTAKAKNLQLVALSSVWNFHACDHLDNVAKRSNSNLHRDLEALKVAGASGVHTLYADSLGRTQHSKTSVAILKGVTNVDEIGSQYYSKRLGEVVL